MNLRDVNNAAFLHRERARFRAGTSALLGIAFDPAPGDGVAIDVAGVPELRAIATSANGSAAIGAFVSIRTTAPASMQRGALRIIGTATGAVIGQLLTSLLIKDQVALSLALLVVSTLGVL